jgi:hypothetical protein
MKKILIVALLGFVPACAAEDGAPNDGEDELAGELEGDGEAGKADGTDNWTYYSIRADIRRCVFPICGGTWVKRVNRDYTYCRGTWTTDECYVSAMDWSRTGLGEDQIQGALGSGYPVLLRGYSADRVYDGFGNYGVFNATELWVANNAKAPEGVYTRVKDNGVRCITTPCNSINESKLNSFLWGNIAGLDFSWSDANEDELAKAYDSLVTTDGLLITGWRFWFRGQGGWGAGRSVEQFFRKVVPAQKTCHVGGCSGQVCSDRDDIVTTCEWRDEYACYDTAACELQSDGNCGWTVTDELTACLDNPPTP